MKSFDYENEEKMVGNKRWQRREEKRDSLFILNVRTKPLHQVQLHLSRQNKS